VEADPSALPLAERWSCGLSTHDGKTNIYGRDLASDRSFVVTSHGTVVPLLGGPALSGERVVWADCLACVKGSGLPGFSGTGIYLKNVRGSAERLLSVKGRDAYAPAISGTMVVWVAHHDRKTDIYGRDLTTGRMFRVSFSGAAKAPSVSGRIVVWPDARGRGWDIYGRDLRTGREFVVARHNRRRDYLDNPLISGSTVVWTSRPPGESIAIEGEYLSTRFRFTRLLGFASVTIIPSSVRT
jgi:beta propeller repeat protein